MAVHGGGGGGVARKPIPTGMDVTDPISTNTATYKVAAEGAWDSLVGGKWTVVRDGARRRGER